MRGLKTIDQVHLLAEVDVIRRSDDDKQLTKFTYFLEKGFNDQMRVLKQSTMFTYILVKDEEDRVG